MILSDYSLLHSQRGIGESLARDLGIVVGCGSHVLTHTGNGTPMQLLRTYATVFPTIEFTTTLAQLPELPIVREVLDIAGLRPIWRVSIGDIGEHREYATGQAWGSFINALHSDAERNSIILTMERTCEYDAKHLDILLELMEELFPLPSFLEFEHHSWKRASRVLTGAKVPVVQHDAPELPGIIKDIAVPGKRTMLRLLGRDKRHWFEHHPSERFAYQYSPIELESIATRIRTMREESDSVTVIVATHPAASALDNAVAIASILSH